MGGAEEAVRCDVVSLYHGGVYDTYKYHRYQDVRLVFAPEEAIASFGGDPDNFNFPRFDLDMALIRAYENGKPANVSRLFHDIERRRSGERADNRHWKSSVYTSAEDGGLPRVHSR